jgi:hypothetical protein
MTEKVIWKFEDSEIVKCADQTKATHHNFLPEDNISLIASKVLNMNAGI